jgi:hydroxymethylbilane synthase
MPKRTIRIGTRGSKLALHQAQTVQAQLSGSSEIKIIKTSGDRFQEAPLHQQNGIGFFTKEIENELLKDNIDLAVHSLKDLPTSLGPGLVLAAVMPRDAAGDLLLVTPQAHDPSQLIPIKSDCTVGASSLRRQALLKTFRPDLKAKAIRGNVPTRIKKAASGDYDAIILSRAGLIRLAIDPQPLIAFDLNPAKWVCAAGQGVIAVEARADDQTVLAQIKHLDDQDTRQCTQTERNLLVFFEGGCHAPFGAWAQFQDQGYRLVLGAEIETGRFVRKDISASDLNQAQKIAESWIQAGLPQPDPHPHPKRSDSHDYPSPASGRGIIRNKRNVRGEGGGETCDQEEEWICRPAQPWY